MYRGKYEAVKRPEKKPETENPQVTTQEQPSQDSGTWDGTVKKPQRRPKKRITVGKIVFYSIWLLIIVAFIIGMSIAMKALKKWLVDFEASQPDNMSQQIYHQYFETPDWATLYEMGGIEDTIYEDVNSYVSYMHNTVGDGEITMVETSAGLTGGKKFVLRAELSDGEYYNFATFSMVDKKAEGALISDWQLGEVNIFTHNSDNSMTFRRDNGYKFLLLPDSTVMVNGVALDESHVIRTVATVAEGYLPEGVHGYRLMVMTVDGLLVEPEIQILKTDGTQAEVEYDAENRAYFEKVPMQNICDEEYTTVFTAAKTYCQYMIGAVGAWDLRSYFDHTTEIYKTITTNTTWMQGYKGYDFGPETVGDFYRYSDTLYSARVTVDLNVTRPDGTVKVYALSTTFFMELQDSGWRVIEMTNVDVQAQTDMVRLTYVDGDTVLATEMVDTSSKKLTPPQITVPEGKTFLGWYVQAGRLEMGDDGVITLPAEFELEPMTIYALFGNGEG